MVASPLCSPNFYFEAHIQIRHTTKMFKKKKGNPSDVSCCTNHEAHQIATGYLNTEMYVLCSHGRKRMLKNIHKENTFCVDCVHFPCVFHTRFYLDAFMCQNTCVFGVYFAKHTDFNKKKYA